MVGTLLLSPGLNTRNLYKEAVNVMYAGALEDYSLARYNCTRLLYRKLLVGVKL